MISQALNFIAFQILWFGSVIGGGALGKPWIASLSMVPLVLLALSQPSRFLDFKLAITATVMGLSLDYLWIKLGILSFNGFSIPPMWMGFLWFGFALTINHSMKFFRDLPIAGPFAVGLFGPITYLAGEKLEAVMILDYFLLTLIIPTWMLLFHLLRTISRRIDDQLLLHDSKSKLSMDHDESNTLKECTYHD